MNRRTAKCTLLMFFDVCPFFVSFAGKESKSWTSLCEPHSKPLCGSPNEKNDFRNRYWKKDAVLFRCKWKSTRRSYKWWERPKIRKSSKDKTDHHRESHWARCTWSIGRIWTVHSHQTRKRRIFRSNRWSDKGSKPCKSSWKACKDWYHRCKNHCSFWTLSPTKALCSWLWKPEQTSFLRKTTSSAYQESYTGKMPKGPMFGLDITSLNWADDFHFKRGGWANRFFDGSFDPTGCRATTEVSDSGELPGSWKNKCSGFVGWMSGIGNG